MVGVSEGGSPWQQCHDQSTGYPYYWNTLTNEVRWDCPQATLAPPGLVTNISLATPQTQTTSTAARHNKQDSDNIKTKAELKTVKAKQSLVSGYGSDEDDTEDDPGDEVVDKTDDLLAQIEAEMPPDYEQPEEPRNQQLPSISSKVTGSSNAKPTSSILALATNYDDDSDNEEEEEDGKKVMQIDNYGRMVFNQEDNSDLQTEEQKQALAKYHIENLKSELLRKKNEGEVESKRERFDNSIPGSRKRRLDLPGGKFNKTDNFSKDQSNNEVRETMMFVPFVKSSIGIAGTIGDNPEAETKTPHEEDNDVDEVKQEEASKESNESKLLPCQSDSSPPSPASDDVGSLTAELVEKLEHFKVGQEKVSSVKNIAIKLEALYSAWTAGALTLSYIQTFLQNARSKITEAEGSLASHPWRPVWDRDRRVYCYINDEDGSKSDTYPPTSRPPPCDSSTPPPPPPEVEHAPPPPPPQDEPIPAPPHGNGADHQLQDMEIEEDNSAAPTSSITEELSMFYSEIDGGQAAASPAQREESNDVDSNSIPDDNSLDSQTSQPDSPAHSQAKKRKKVKVSNNLALKKKGVGDMLAKWQKIK